MNAWRSLLVVLTMIVIGGCANTNQPKIDVAEDIIKRSTDTVNRFKTTPELQRFDIDLDQAVAVAVFPRLIKAGFIGGAEGGHGVLLKRQPNGQFGPPAFYSLVAGSVGFQIGIQNTEVIMLVMNDSALTSIVEDQGKLGADVGITVGLIGVGLEGATTTSLGADVVAYANAILGAYAGVSFEGAALVRRSDLNQAFYNSNLGPSDILAGGVSQPSADPLIRILGQR